MGTGARIGHAALALGVVIAAGGCPKHDAAFQPKFKPSYVISVVFKGGCADDVDVDEKNCDASAPRDCLRVRPGEEVTFEAVPATTGAAPNEFEIQFDPFRDGSITSKNGKTKKLKIDAPVAADKSYRFNVRTVTPPPGTTCKVIDPQIIVD